MCSLSLRPLASHVVHSTRAQNKLRGSYTTRGIKSGGGRTRREAWHQARKGAERRCSYNQLGWSWRPRKPEKVRKNLVLLPTSSHELFAAGHSIRNGQQQQLYLPLLSLVLFHLPWWHQLPVRLRKNLGFTVLFSLPWLLLSSWWGMVSWDLILQRRNNNLFCLAFGPLLLGPLSEIYGRQITSRFAINKPWPLLIRSRVLQVSNMWYFGTHFGYFGRFCNLISLQRGIWVVVSHRTRISYSFFELWLDSVVLVLWVNHQEYF